MFEHLKRFNISSLLVILLAIFTVINTNTSLDILAFLIIVFIILNKIFGEYFILILIAARPIMDYWRDFSLFSLGSFDLNINAALSILLLGWSLYFFWKNREDLKKIPATPLLLLFLAWCSVSLFYSYDPASTVGETLKAANLFALFGMSYLLTAKNNAFFKKWFYRALGASAVIPISLSLYQFFTKTGLTIDGVPNRIYGTFAHPNIMSTFALLLFMIIADEFLRKRKWKPDQGWQIAGGIFMLVIIALTYTRIVWIGTALFLFIMGIKYYHKALIAGAVSVGLFYLLFYPVNTYLINTYNYNLQSINLIARLTSRNEEADSIQWRADVANKVLPLWRQRLLQGYGYGSFAKVWDDNKGVENLWDNTSEAHNDYLKVGFEAGIVGLAIFLSIFGLLIYRQIKFGVKNNWVNLAFIASIFTYLTLSASDNMLHHTPVIWLLWALWGMWAREYEMKE